MATTVELQEGEKIYRESQIEKMLGDLDEYKLKSHEQKILINQSIKVFGAIEKMFPGLVSGKGIGPADIMNVSKLLQNNKTLMDDIGSLKKCIDIYTSKNPILK